MRGISNPKVSKGFLQEIYKKEVRIGLDSVSKHKKAVPSTALFKGEPKKYDNSTIYHTQAVAKLYIAKRDQLASESYQKAKAPTPPKFIKKEELIDKLSKTIDVELDAQAVADLANEKLDEMPAGRRIKAPVKYNGVTANDIRKGDQLMRPIDKPMKELITEGTKEYFKKRHQMKPEDKYYFPQSTNWQYGWRLQDSLVKMNRPAHPRVHVLGVREYPKVGLQPDPWYYGNPHQLCSSICAL